MIGTLYPIILDALNYEKISVGEPYFNTVFLPIMLPLLLLMGLAPHMNWGQQNGLKLWKKIRLSLLISILFGFFMPIVLGLCISFFNSYRRDTRNLDYCCNESVHLTNAK